MRYSVSCFNLFSGTKESVFVDKATTFPFTEGEILNKSSLISCPAIHSDLSKLNTILTSLSLETSPEVKLEMYSLYSEKSDSNSSVDFLQDCTNSTTMKSERKRLKSIVEIIKFRI